MTEAVDLIAAGLQMKIFLAGAMYAGILVLLWIMNRREFRRCPEKGERYRKLPLPYKMMCWCGVVPLFVASIFVDYAFFLLALVAFAAVEILCVRWYVKKGLWSM